MSSDDAQRRTPEVMADAGGPVEEEPPAQPGGGAWLRVRKSALVRVDKINCIRVQRRDGDYFLEIRADRDVHVPVPDRAAALEALEAIHAGVTDISEWTVPRSFMQD